MVIYYGYFFLYYNYSYFVLLFTGEYPKYSCFFNFTLIRLLVYKSIIVRRSRVVCSRRGRRLYILSSP